jgi:hypothetical protein
VFTETVHVEYKLIATWQHIASAFPKNAMAANTCGFFSQPKAHKASITSPRLA